jgi:hypothetical protein
LLLGDWLPVELGAFEELDHLSGEGVALVAERRELVLGAGVGAVAGAIALERVSGGGERVEVERSDGRLDLLVDRGERPEAAALLRCRRDRPAVQEGLPREELEQLARQIRSGDVPEDALERLQEHVAAKLRIASPRYLDRY